MTVPLRLDPEAALRVPDRVLMREVGGEMVLLDVDAERYYGLNDVGARLMGLAAEGLTLRRAVELLQEEFDVDRATLEADVRRVAEDLAAAGLLEAG